MRIVFIGTGEIGVPVLRSLLALAGTRACRRRHAAGQTGRARATDRSAADQSGAGRHRAADSSTGADSNDEEAVAEIRALAPDVIVVMAYGQILPRSVLEIPRIACLNLHASLLPRHRGAAPIQAAIVAGDREIGHHRHVHG